MGEKWGFFLLFDAIIAHRCATMRYDSASPKTGAWPSLVGTLRVRQKKHPVPDLPTLPTNLTYLPDLPKTDLTDLPNRRTS